MSTRSRVGILEDGKVTSVYCHFDGYIENNGVVLFLYYSDIAQVKELLSYGDISSLGKSPAKGYTRYYTRDMGEPSKQTAPIVDGDVGLFQKRADNEVDYLYLYDLNNKKWYVLNSRNQQKNLLSLEILLLLKKGALVYSPYIKDILLHFMQTDQLECEQN